MAGRTAQRTLTPTLPRPHRSRPCVARWIQQSVAVANLSARFCNQLWSDDDPDCIARMEEILKESVRTTAWPARGQYAVST